MIGDDIRLKREELGLSQEEVARALKTTQQTIQRVESNRSPHSAYIQPLIEFLNLNSSNNSLKESPDVHPMKKALVRREARLNYPADWNDLEDIIRKRRADKNIVKEPSTTIPVYGMGDDPSVGSFIGPDPIEYIDRSEPLLYSTEAYAVKIPNDAMYPALKISEVALVNPALSPFLDEPHLFIQKQSDAILSTVKIGYLEKYSIDTWTVKIFQPVGSLELSRTEFPECHRIVGKFTRR